MASLDEAGAGGDRRGFEERCLELLDPILRYARASVSSAHDAEDLAQEVFAQAFRSREQFTGGDLKAWLYRIARSRIAMHYRRQAVERRGRDELMRGAPRKAASAEAGGEERVPAEEFRAAALAAIESLGEVEREAIRLKFSMACSNVEIARMLEVTPGNLGVILFRALRKVRREMEARGYA